MTDNFQKSTRTTAIDHINAGRAQLNQLERLVNEHMSNENTPLYKWDMIPAGYDFATCDTNAVCMHKRQPEFLDGMWVCTKPFALWESGTLPLTVLNRLPGEPSTTLEKRPGVE